MVEFTPWSSFAGGVLIGLAASVLLIGLGRIAGISGIAGGLLLGARDRAWRVSFLLGMLASGSLAARLVPGSVGDAPGSVGMIALAVYSSASALAWAMAARAATAYVE